MMIDACAWDNPGANPYRGTFVEWVQRLPAETRLQLAPLADRVARHQYDDLVYIDKHGTRSSLSTASYSGPSYMAFGRADICGTVRMSWDDKQLQAGMVFCAGDTCAVRWSVCNNWSIVSRRHTIEALPLIEPARVAHAAYVALPPPEAETSSIEPEPTEAATFARFTDGYTPLSGPGYALLAPVPPVPEPSTWALFVVGLLVIVHQYRRRK